MKESVGQTHVYVRWAFPTWAKKAGLPQGQPFTSLRSNRKIATERGITLSKAKLGCCGINKSGFSVIDQKSKVKEHENPTGIDFRYMQATLIHLDITDVHRIVGKHRELCYLS